MWIFALGLAAALQTMDDPVALEVTRDRISDRVSAFATIRGDRGMLAIGCEPRNYRGVRVTLRSRYFLARENVVTGARSFPIRFDRDPARPGRWTTTGRQGWLRGGTATRAFIARARGAREVAVRAVDVEGRELDLVFPLAGAQGTINQALAICARGVRAPTT
jgi:hypothetical protein